jgi:hypothetical protein
MFHSQSALAFLDVSRRQKRWVKWKNMILGQNIIPTDVLLNEQMGVFTRISGELTMARANI